MHLYVAYSPLSVSLDLCLEDMASRYPGTKFLRGLGVTSLLFAEGDGGDQKWKKGDLPMVVALKEGRVVAFSSGLHHSLHKGMPVVIHLEVRYFMWNQSWTSEGTL